MQTKEIRELKCVLKEDELKNYSMELARKQQDLAQADMDRKAAAAAHKEKMERLASEINTVSRNVVNGYEFRNVECRWEYDYKEGVKRLYRQDTFELVDTKGISEYERQQHLELEEKENGEEREEPPTPERTKNKTKRRPSATA